MQTVGLFKHSLFIYFTKVYAGSPSVRILLGTMGVGYTKRIDFGLNLPGPYSLLMETNVHTQDLIIGESVREELKGINS